MNTYKTVTISVASQVPSQSSLVLTHFWSKTLPRIKNAGVCKYLFLILLV